MNNQALILIIQTKVKEVLSQYDPSHDWWHSYRVWKMARFLAKKEGANLLVTELSALLHDVGDWKFQANGKEGITLIKEWLHELAVEASLIMQIGDIAQGISFKGAYVKQAPLSLEGKIVQDADRLDAIGAIGVARTFTFGGYKRRPMFDPTVPLHLPDTFEAYQQHQGTTINHFYEKLFLLKDQLHTATAQKIAQARHSFMENFLNQFKEEWDFAENI